MQESLFFLVNQMQNSETGADHEEKKLEIEDETEQAGWETFGLADALKQEELSTANKVLEAYVVKMKDHMQQLASRIEDLEVKIKNAFADYCKIPNYLHAILVHDGLAESGHYYSFIFDRKQNCWWRFSDHNVQMETEADVFKESIGGQAGSHKTAYSLIYVNQYIEDLIHKQPYSAHQMDRVNLGIANNLREAVVLANNSFN